MSEWTPERIAELRALCDAATPGEWIAKVGIIFSEAHPFDRGRESRAAVAYFRDEFRATGHLLDNNGDGAFIAAARTALPAALDEIERLRAEIEDWRGRLATQCGQTLAADIASDVVLIELRERDQRREQLLRDVYPFIAAMGPTLPPNDLAAHIRDELGEKP